MVQESPGLYRSVTSCSRTNRQFMIVENRAYAATNPPMRYASGGPDTRVVNSCLASLETRGLVIM